MLQKGIERLACNCIWSCCECLFIVKLKIQTSEQQYDVVLLGTGWVRVKFGFWLTGKLGLNDVTIPHPEPNPNPTCHAPPMHLFHKRPGLPVNQNPNLTDTQPVPNRTTFYCCFWYPQNKSSIKTLI